MKILFRLLMVILALLAFANIMNGQTKPYSPATAETQVHQFVNKANNQFTSIILSKPEEGGEFTLSGFEKKYVIESSTQELIRLNGVPTFRTRIMVYNKWLMKERAVIVAFDRIGKDEIVETKDNGLTIAHWDWFSFDSHPDSDNSDIGIYENPIVTPKTVSATGNE